MLLLYIKIHKAPWPGEALVSNEQWVRTGGEWLGRGTAPETPLVARCKAWLWDRPSAAQTAQTQSATSLWELDYPLSVGRITSTCSQHIWTTWAHPRTRGSCHNSTGTGAGKQNKSCLSGQQKCPLGETASLPAFEVPSKPPLEREFWQWAHSLCVSAVFLQKYLSSRRKRCCPMTLLRAE